MSEDLTTAQLNDISWGAPAPEVKEISLNTFLERIRAAFETQSGQVVSPENCMRSPTVHAIVTAVSRRIAISPVQVFKVERVGRRVRKVEQPSHPLQRLLNNPNEFQTRVDYWMDATSSLLRHGRYFGHKGRGGPRLDGTRSPVRRIMPLNATSVMIKTDTNFNITFQVDLENGNTEEYSLDEMHYVRSAARDFLRGDSPVMDVREAIATEIAIEQYGASFFGNGALPLVFFKMMEGHAFKSQTDEDDFVESFQKAFGGKKRFKGMLVPKGIETDIQETDQEKTQFNETRKLLRTVIAGAWNVPPHMVGDLERATFNNVEQQDTDFKINVVMPYAQMFEAALERDFLTEQQRRDGFIVRFNLDAVMRADFVSRQEGLNIQRMNGIINPNDWLAIEDQNPISEEDGGEDYLRPLNMIVPGEPTPMENPRQPQQPPGTGEDDE